MPITTSLSLASEGKQAHTPRCQVRQVENGGVHRQSLEALPLCTRLCEHLHG